MIPTTAFRKTLARRLLGNVTKPTRPFPQTFSSKPSTLLERILCKSDTDNIPFRRFLHHQNNLRPVCSSSSSPVHSFPVAEMLLEKLRGMNDDYRKPGLDTLVPPSIPPYREERKRGGITVEEVRKLSKVSQMEEVKARLRNVKKAYVSCGEFVQICRSGGDGSLEHGLRVAKQLDESGAVLVIGSVVFLRPELVARAIESVITTTSSSIAGKEQELRALEEEKTLIDRKAMAGVKKELCCGLGFLVVQTLGFMRLTFWELSWDVMEPICFYVTSVYFMAGYAFFLRTSKDPSFEGVFESRFAAKQKRLMKTRNFDLDRFLHLREELGRRCSRSLAPPCLDFANCSNYSANYCDCHRRCVLGLVQY